METTYNLNFLNSYFTTKEFNFINNSSLESQELDNLILRENETRDIIVNFINNFSDSSDEFKQILDKAQVTFEKINENIRMVHDLKVYSSEISDKITTLLIEVEANPSNKDIYIERIQELKSMINDFSSSSEETKSKLLLNDEQINSFLQEKTVKEYLSDFNIGIKLQVSQSSQIDSSIQAFDDLQDNNLLLISEKAGRVFLPYSRKEVLSYWEQYPKDYISCQDVINKEFIFSYDYYTKHTVVARFREAYALIRDREAKSIIDAFKFAIDIMFNYDVNPAIIAACKTEDQLTNYMNCLEHKKLDEFQDFEIKYEVSPMKIYNKKC